jgi:hypothetical protein
MSHNQNQTQTQENEELTRFYIKHINTDQYIVCFYPASISVSEFIYEIQKIGREIIGVNDYKMVEVIEAGQEIPGVKPENAPKMEEENISIYQKYGANLKNMAFYIRKNQRQN